MRVGLVYIDSAFNQDDFNYLNKLLDVEGIDFRIHNKGREITNSVDELSSAINIVLNFIGSGGFLVSVGAGAAWDSFKSLVKYVFIKTEGKKVYKVTSKKVEEQDRTISITTHINNNEFHFKLDGLKSAEEVEMALERLLPVIEKQFLEAKDNNQIYIANFDKELNEWATKNFLEEIRKTKGL